MVAYWWVAEYSVNPDDGYKIGPTSGRVGPFATRHDAMRYAQDLLDEMVDSPYLDDMVHETRIYHGSRLVDVLKGPAPKKKTIKKTTPKRKPAKR